VHILDHLPGVTPWLTACLSIVRATLVAYLQASTGVLDSTTDSIKIF
jgi:hypothetical protein